jgi:hypothetical protein
MTEVTSYDLVFSVRHESFLLGKPACLPQVKGQGSRMSTTNLPHEHSRDPPPVSSDPPTLRDPSTPEIEDGAVPRALPFPCHSTIFGLELTEAIHEALEVSARTDSHPINMAFAAS